MVLLNSLNIFTYPNLSLFLYCKTLPMLEQIENHFSIAVGFLGILVVCLLFYFRKSNPLINIYLIIILVFASFGLVDQGIFKLYRHSFVSGNYYWIKPLLLFGIPSFYLYFKTLFNTSQNFDKKHLVHFIYPVLNISLKVVQPTLVALEKNFVPELQKLSVFVFILFYFFKLSYIMYRKFLGNDQEGATQTDHFQLIKKWSVFFCVIAFLLFIRLLFVLYIELIAEEMAIGFVLSLIKSSIWFVLFIKIISSPEILYGYHKLENRLLQIVKPIKVPNPLWDFDDPPILNLQDAKLQTIVSTLKTEYIKELTTFLNMYQPFRKSKYDVQNLSEDLKIPKSHLVFIFKYHCKLSFVEFKKYCRIKDSLSLIATGYLESKTFEALSKKVGFISYNPFYDSFKKYTNQSPKDFLSNKTTDGLI